MTSPDQDHELNPFPAGPALLYVHSEPRLFGEARTVTRVDLGTPVEGGPLSEADARRERKILRALLNQALWLLGDEENEG